MIYKYIPGGILYIISFCRQNENEINESFSNRMKIINKYKSDNKDNNNNNNLKKNGYWLY